MRNPNDPYLAISYPAEGDLEPFLSTDEAADYAGIPRREFHELVTSGRGPALTAFGGVCRYTLFDVERWDSERKCLHHQEA